MKIFRRKKKFIDSKAQLLIAFEIILHSLLFLVLLSFVLFVPPFASWFSNQSISEHQAIAYSLWQMNFSKWPLFIGLAMFVGLISILFSHHLVVGPSYRIRTVIGSLIERDLTKLLKLRRNDYLKEIEQPFNEMVHRLRTDISLTIDKIKKIEAQLEELESKSDLSEGAKVLLENIRQDGKEVRLALAEYKTN